MIVASPPTVSSRFTAQGRSRQPLPENVSALMFVLLAMVSVQFGSAVAKHLIESVGSFTAAWLRILLAGTIALFLWRASLRVDRKALPYVVGLGIAVAGMNLSFYAAIERIPLGMAVTIEFLGPLTVGLLAGRRPINAVWVALAGVGVLLLMDSGGSHSWIGVGLAVLSGVGWGSYIAFSDLVARHTTGHSGLALAMGLGAVAAVPMLLTGAGNITFTWWLLVGVLAVAALSSLIPHAVELSALRRMDASAFGVLMSLEPALAAVVGLVLLDQDLQAVQWAGIGLVVLASAGATHLSSRVDPARRDSEPTPLSVPATNALPRNR
ncbi:EamA family transporter [Nocardia sp. NPDC019395]|uniref:EamA family transporter n=1 Tax=Nocardia sp. NPDC019395 TaxID=3154686 RepID=UPI0033C4C7C1